MPKAPQTPGSVLKSLLDEYQLNPSSLSKLIGLSNSAVRQIVIGKSGITVPTALRLSKFFGQSPAFWLDLQLQADMQAAANDKELQDSLKAIPKAKKPTASSKGKAQTKPVKKETLADKRKKAEKIPGAKPARGRRPVKTNNTARKK